MEHLQHILFIDIETVPLVSDFNNLTTALQTEWVKKSRYQKSATMEDASPEMLFGERAGIFSEFAKVVCIGFGMLVLHENEWKLRLKHLTGDDEKVLLKDFCTLLSQLQQRYNNFSFCGHNIKEFDIPFLCRRMIINGLPLPGCMQLSGKKPWEIAHQDTMDLWRFGDYKNFTPLSLLAAVLGIPSPKEDMDGSKVGAAYWKDGDLTRIADYCLRDVLTTAKVYLKLKGYADVDLQPIM